ncbi:MAG: NADH-quinone oxidoreductase subunit J [Anaerolineales bacterium]|nr:NADH-quinone oxidoreductase subunit J [Anaerolineales bacterium]
MTTLQLIFLLIGAITVVAAIMVVLSPNLIHAALWLILTLAGVAVNFVLLQADFLAVVQVAVYIDAIAILIIVTIMLTRHVMVETDSQINRNWLWAALIAVILFAALLFLLNQVPAWTMDPPPLAYSSEDTIKALGRSLVDVDQYIIPFEVASVLLLAALIGAIVVARPPGGGTEAEEGGEG